MHYMHCQAAASSSDEVCAAASVFSHVKWALACLQHATAANHAIACVAPASPDIQSKACGLQGSTDA